MAGTMTTKITTAQRRSLTACIAEVRAIQDRQRKARGEAGVSDETSIPVDCDQRSAGCLVEAGLARWARGFDNAITVTPKGFANA
jgi:hypothetical protein